MKDRCIPGPEMIAIITKRHLCHTQHCALCPMKGSRVDLGPYRSRISKPADRCRHGPWVWFATSHRCAFSRITLLSSQQTNIGSSASADCLTDIGALPPCKPLGTFQLKSYRSVGSCIVRALPTSWTSSACGAANRYSCRHSAQSP